MIFDLGLYKNNLERFYKFSFIFLRFYSTFPLLHDFYTIADASYSNDLMRFT